VAARPALVWIEDAVGDVTGRSARAGGCGTMTTYIAGGIALVISGGYLGLLAYKVQALPLVIVLLLGFIAMVASLLDEIRAERD
jgi:hypothetical protein